MAMAMERILKVCNGNIGVVVVTLFTKGVKSKNSTENSENRPVNSAT
jgi:hypothetical protein